MRSFLLFLMILVPAISPVIGQYAMPLKAGLLVEQISLPTFQDYGSRLGYGFTLGTNFTYKEKVKSALLQTADFHIIHHEEYGTLALMLLHHRIHTALPGVYHLF